MDVDDLLFQINNELALIDGDAQLPVDQKMPVTKILTEEGEVYDVVGVQTEWTGTRNILWLNVELDESYGD